MEQENKRKLVELGLKIAEAMEVVLEQMKAYENQSWLSPEDESRYSELKKAMKESLPAITQLRDFIGQEAYQRSTAYYYNVKEKAAAGDPRAKEIYDELRPLYEQALSEQIHKN